MPYIRPFDRERLEEDIRILAEQIHTAGELNYVITRLALARVLDEGYTYTTLRGTYGDILAAASEFYRRIIAPYEDQKIQENGDVF